MDTQKEIKKIDKELYKFYNEDDYGEIAGEWVSKKIKKVLNNERKSPITVLGIFKELSEYRLDDTLQILYSEQEESKAKAYFTQSTAYGYLHIEMADTLWGCKGEASVFKVRTKQEFEAMSLPARYMAQALLCGWKDKATYIAEDMIASINFGRQELEGYTIHKLIACGHEYTPGAWFALEVYCKAYDREFDRTKADYPDKTDMIPYETVLKKWDTTDETEIDKFVFLMCEKHIQQAQEQKTDNDYFEFGNTYSKLFPYEILTWLKFREEIGLKNPHRFSHPLMQTVIAKFFLEFKEPLPYPKELPYAKELLEKLKEQCPDVEIPEWLDSSSDSTTNENAEETKEEKHNKDNIIPDDFFVKE